MGNYLINLNLKGKRVVIIGGGKVATRKILGLLGNDAELTVVAPIITPEIQKIDQVKLVKRKFLPRDLIGADLIFICTNQSQVNQDVLRLALPSQLVNDCTNKKNSDFYNVSTIRGKDYTLGLATDNLSPKRNQELKKQLVGIIDKIN